jgi:type IV fimbrial biogenesis protein FimT
MQRTPHTTRKTQRGISLVDQAVTMAVVSTILGTAVPSLQGLRDRQALEGLAGQMESELQWARTEAVSRNEAVRFTFDAANRCYVVHTGGPRDCRCTAAAAPVCTSGAQALRHWSTPADARSSVTSNSTSFAFNPMLGTVTPTATLEVTNPRGEALRLVVNIMGRVRSCSPGGTLTGYARC